MKPEIKVITFRDGEGKLHRVINDEEGDFVQAIVTGKPVKIDTEHTTPEIVSDKIVKLMKRFDFDA